MSRSTQRSTPPTTNRSTPSPGKLAGNERREPTFEEIAARAYQRFQARNGEHGQDMEDWLQAERELKLGRL